MTGTFDIRPLTIHIPNYFDIFPTAKSYLRSPILLKLESVVGKVAVPALLNTIPNLIGQFKDHFLTTTMFMSRAYVSGVP